MQHVFDLINSQCLPCHAVYVLFSRFPDVAIINNSVFTLILISLPGCNILCVKPGLKSAIPSRNLAYYIYRAQSKCVHWQLIKDVSSTQNNVVGLQKVIKRTVWAYERLGIAKSMQGACPAAPANVNTHKRQLRSPTEQKKAISGRQYYCQLCSDDKPMVPELKTFDALK